MKNKASSDTYKLLYNHIISQLLFQICSSNKKFCVRYNIGNDTLPFAIWKKFSEYEDKALSKMQGKRLDRHKLASCLCGAIIETKPLAPFNNAKVPKNVNEILALHIGLNVIKAFMIYDAVCSISSKPEEFYKMYEYMKSSFEMRLPNLDQNICDTQDYGKNIVNALYWSHENCNIKNEECFRYDIWGYSKIFYHLELFNKPYFDECYKKYLNIIDCHN